MKKLNSIGIGISLVLSSALGANAFTLRQLETTIVNQTDPFNDATPNNKFEINNVSVTVSDLVISVTIDTNVALTGVPWNRASGKSVGWSDVIFTGDNGKQYAVRFGSSDFHNPQSNLNTTGVYLVSDLISRVSFNDGHPRHFGKPTHADNNSLLLGNLISLNTIKPLDGISKYRHSFSFDSFIFDTGTYDVSVSLECYNDFLDMVVPVVEATPPAYNPPEEFKTGSVPESSNLVALAGLVTLGFTFRQKPLK